MSALSEKVRKGWQEGMDDYETNLDIVALCDEHERLEAEKVENLKYITTLLAEKATSDFNRNQAINETRRLEGLLRAWAIEEEEWTNSSKRYRFEDNGTAALDALLAEAVRLKKENPCTHKTGPC